jgi:hypothetical protein
MNRAPVLVAVTVLLGLGCSLGEGEGQVYSDKLAVEGCWNGPFDLTPDFFAAVPYRRTLDLRIQHGGDLEEVSDGLTVLVDDIDAVAAQREMPLAVGLPVGVRPIGVPIVYQPDPPTVHLTLYLHRSCHAQNSALYSTGGTITFHAIFNGDPSEADAEKRLTYAEFSDITVADPRNMAQDGTVRDESHVRGYFRFYFQRGQPAQPFP